MQDTGRKFSHHDLIPVGFLQSGDQQLGLYRTVVDKEGLQVAAGTGIGGSGNVAGQRVILPAAFHFDHSSGISSVNAVDRGLQTAVAGSGEHLLAIPQELDKCS